MGSKVSFYLIQPRPQGYFRCKEEGCEREVLSFPHLKNPGNEVVPDYVPLNKICKCNLKLMAPIKNCLKALWTLGTRLINAYLKYSLQVLHPCSFK